jgi:disulfide bond formation protein DsbB
MMRTVPVSAPVFAASILVIAGVFFFQYGMGLIPCELCLLDRWPWYVAIVLSGLALVILPRSAGHWAALLFVAVFLVSSGLGGYHTGVEQHVFTGPTACTSTASSSHSVDDLLKQLKATPAIRCDEPQWTLFGVSLAGFDLIASVLLTVYCLVNIRRRAP